MPLSKDLCQNETRNARRIEQIFDEMGGKLFSYLKVMLKDEHRAEDVLQNVFVRFYKAWMADYPIRNLQAFLFTLARNEYRRELEKKKETIGLETAVFELKQDETMSPSEKASIEEALLSLPSDQREVVYCKIYGDMTFQEIAQTLEISINTAASRYRYGMEKLTELLR